jgi:two-component system chemotaxis sensor kinase CheA
LFSEFLSKEQLGEVMDITAMVFSKNDRSKSLVYLGLMPGELIIGRRNIRFEYKIIELEERKQIMVIMADITEKLQLENQMAEERKNLKLIIKCITSMSELKLAMESFAEFYQNALSEREADKDFPEETLRQIHTFKGDFSQLSMYNTSEKLHVLENGISGIIREGADSARRIREYLRTTDSESIMRGDRQIIGDILGSGYLDKEDYLNLSKERLAVVEKRLTERFGANYAQEIQRIMSMLQYISLKQAVRQYDDYIQAMAERLEKKIMPIIFTGQDVYVEKSAYYNLIRSLVHIFRNIADHGIEYPELRELMGKDGCGHITVDIAVSEDREVVLHIEDDGAGIDCGEVRNKAIQKGLITAQQAERMSETETLELLFEQGFSTKENVTAISGRGVGLPAVRAQLNNKGGSIRISSRQGEGTAFELRFPVDAEYVDICGLAG